jgi:hypothetical protein
METVNDYPCKNFLILFCINLILSGCISSSAPKDNVDFANVERLSGLDGTYQNQSEWVSDQTPYYLSSLIWPDDKIDPKTIDAIEVKAITDNTIQVKGLGETEVKKESILVEGKDFNFHAGRIVLDQHTEFGPQAGGIFVGPSTGSSELGLDQQGHGKLKKSLFFAGLAFLVYPIVAGGSEDVMFKRIK